MAGESLLSLKGKVVWASGDYSNVINDTKRMIMSSNTAALTEIRAGSRQRDQVYRENLDKVDKMEKESGERLVNSKKIKKKGSIFARMGITAYTLEDTSGTKGFDNKARGGPVAKGKTYVVGEGGPEYFLPKQSGKILSNDDSRIFAMLLTANPQLQQVSRTRAEKILRNRFPEYFE